MNEGGYGKPLGNKGGTDLTGFLKIKLRGSGLRVVYKLVHTESEMLIVVVGARADNEVYETAEQKLQSSR
jgi:mRNA interferase RelE/StbE